MKHHLENGFTLIELLVIIAIIGVLAALLFPVFARAREKARQTVCLSNMRQLATACDLYLNDYDETFPPRTWDGAIYPYVNNAQVFCCPDDGNRAITDKGATLYPVSYAYNINMLIGVTPRRKRSDLTSPAQTVLLFEETGLNVQLSDPLEGGRAELQNNLSSNGGDGTNCILTELKGPIYPLNATGRIDNAQPSAFCQGELAIRPGRHNDGSNFAAADGHVKWLQGGQVSAGYDALSPANDQSPIGCRLPFDLTHPAIEPCAAGTGNGKHTLTFSIK